MSGIYKGRGPKWYEDPIVKVAGALVLLALAAYFIWLLVQDLYMYQ